MIFKNAPRTTVVHWVSENSARRIMQSLNANLVYTELRCGWRDYYNVFAVHDARRGNKLVGYVLECYAGGAYIVRPRLPSEPTTATQRETVRIMPHLRYCEAFSGI